MVSQRPVKIYRHYLTLLIDMNIYALLIFDFAIDNNVFKLICICFDAYYNYMYIIIIL